MTLIDFITELFCRVDDDMKGVSKDPRSHLWPSELVSIGVLYVLKAQSQSRFYCWLRLIIWIYFQDYQREVAFFVF